MLAIRLYRCLLTAENLFPDHSEETVMAKRAWDGSCEALGVQLLLNPTVAKLVRFSMLLSLAIA